MILLLGDGEMTEESPDSHHNFSKDRLLQNKLLEADDKSVLDSLKDVYKSKPRVGSAKNESDLLCQEITGWIPKNINFRKTGKGKDGTKESKDSRPRGNLGDKYDNFVFNHYRDPKKYILQYREHHSYFDPLTTAAKKRLYGSNYVPPQQNENNSQTSPNERTRHTFQYTRRENPGKFKDKDNESSKSSSSNNDANAGTEQDTFRDRLLPVASTIRSSRTEKSEHSCISLSRVTVPTPLNLPQTSIGVKRKVSVSNGKQSPNHKPECQEQGQRTLDALATIVDEKQQDKEENEQITSEDSDHSDVISIGRLSTTCLSADVSVKVGPKLEPSCTYHVFPTDLMITKNQQIVPNSMMWNPAKSSLEFRKKRDFDRKATEAGMNSPFKTKDPNNYRLKMASQDNIYLQQLKTQQHKECVATRVNEFPPLAVQDRCLVHSNTRLTEIEDADDLPPSIFFQVQGISSKAAGKPTIEPEQCNNYNLESLKKYDARTVLMLHKHGRSAPPEATRISSAGSEIKESSSSDTSQQRPSTDDTYTFLTNHQANRTKGTPYFKFWNNANHAKVAVNASRHARWCSDMNLKHLAQLVLAEQDAQNPDLCKISNKLNHGPPIASGVDERFLVKTKVMNNSSLTSKFRMNENIHKSPTTSANGENLSWREQLDALRQIKPKTKSKHRKARLFFFKEDGGFEVKGNCNGNPAGKCPDNIDPMDKEQVSQQRRIRHLVEQSKIKFASRFDDLSGSPDMIKGSRPLTDLSVGVSTDSSPKKADVKKTELKITNGMSEKQTSPSASNKTSPRTKVCPSPIWRFPQYQFSYTQIAQFQRSRTCVPTDRRF